MGSLWGYFGVTLGSFWGHFGVILESFWDKFWPKGQQLYFFIAEQFKKQFFEENSLFKLDSEYDTLDLKVGKIWNRKDVNEIPFEELAAAYDSINRIMAEDYATILFKNAVVDKPVNIPRRKTSPKPASAKAPLQDATGAAIGSQPQKYERGFLDKMLGVTPAY